jgi:hypothetical protein
MNYEKFLNTLKGMPGPAMVPDRIWTRIESDLRTRVLPGKLLYFFPKLALVGAAAAILVVSLVSISQRAGYISYMNKFYSTEYIYENCRYPD